MSSFRYNEGGSGAPATAPAPPPFTRSGTSYQQRFPQPAFAAPSLSTEGIQTVSDFLLSLPHPRYWPTLLLTTLVLDPIRTLISNVILLVTSPRTHRVVLRLSVLASLFWAALALAILASIGFYRAWVPDVGRVEEVHLQYGHADGRVPFAVIDLKRSRAVGAPAADGDWFAEEQEYDVSLDLLIPISSANLDLGNFMVSIDLVTDDDRTIFHSSRPAILRPSTPSVRFLSQFAAHMSSRHAGASSLPLPFTSPSLELMTIPLFDRLIVHPSPSRVPFSDPASGGIRAITKAIVRVGREDSEKYWMYGGGHGVGGVVRSDASEQTAARGMVLASSNGAFRSRGELQTVAVGLRFDARLQGLRWFLYAHPILSFLLFTSLFLAFELLSAITLWTIAAVYTSTLPGLDIDLGPDTQYVRSQDDDDGDDEGDDPFTRFASSSTGTATPSTAGLRRRTSRSPSAATTLTGTETTATPSSLTSEDDEDDGEGTVTEGEDESRRPSVAVAAAADDAPLLTPSYRRVLGRLDEETEEETDAGRVGEGVASSSASEGERDVSASASTTTTTTEGQSQSQSQSDE